MYIDKAKVVSAEEIVQAVRKMILKSGDASLVKKLQMLPDESWSRLKNILISR